VTPKTNYRTTEFSWQKANDTDENNAPNQPSRLRTILSRAALVYLGLFLGLSIFMSMLGINPLIHNGILPKCLLVYVGLALILALVSGEASLMDEQARSWLALFRARPFREHSHKRESDPNSNVEVEENVTPNPQP
jgi:hypothetical protein